MMRIIVTTLLCFTYDISRIKFLLSKMALIRNILEIASHIHKYDNAFKCHAQKHMCSENVIM